MWAAVTISLLVSAALVLGTAYILLLVFTPHTIPRIASETTYLSARNPTNAQPLPSLSDAASVALSVIVPAYNERDRLEVMLDEAVEHLRGETQHGGRYEDKVTEILVIDDGSKDGTAEKALEIAQKWEKESQNGSGSGGHRGSKAGTAQGVEIRVIRLERNRGKGGAVRHGVLLCRGERILFADADGASKFSDLAALQTAMDKITSSSSPQSLNGLENGNAKGFEINGGPPRNGHSAQVPLENGKSAPGGGSTIKKHFRKLSLSNGSASEVEEKRALQDKLRGHGVVVGSRAHLVTSEAVVKRSLVRNLLMHGFHLFLRTLGVSGVRDTQCGFKLFTRETARTLFPSMHLHRWSFDVELLLLASLLRIPISEVPIDWHEVSGSKISIALDGLGMARDLLVLRGNLLLGRWGLPELSAGVVNESSIYISHDNCGPSEVEKANMPQPVDETDKEDPTVHIQPAAALLPQRHEIETHTDGSEVHARPHTELPHPGDGHVRLQLASTNPDSTATFTHLTATYPLKLLPPTRLPSQPKSLGVCYMLAYGGGLVAGDEISLRVEVGDGARLVLLTQGSTKVFKNRPGMRPMSSWHQGREKGRASGSVAKMADTRSTRTRQRLHTTLGQGSILLLLPDPIQPFRDSSYAQSQRFVIPACPTRGARRTDRENGDGRSTDEVLSPASLIVLDWFTSGRKHSRTQPSGHPPSEDSSDGGNAEAARQKSEEWDFHRYSSLNEIVDTAGRVIMRERLILEGGGVVDVPVKRASSEPYSLSSDGTVPNATGMDTKGASIGTRLLPYTIYATLLIHGPALTSLLTFLTSLTRSPSSTQFQAGKADSLTWSFSPVDHGPAFATAAPTKQMDGSPGSEAHTAKGNQQPQSGGEIPRGGVFRVAGMETEAVKTFLAEVLSQGGVKGLMGETIWERVF